MKVKSWGTRGSISISNSKSVSFGGNTTCYEVISDCIPRGCRLMIDAGTGFVPAGFHYLSQLGNGLRYVILFTHYHYDHILGLTLAPPTFIDQLYMDLYGPVDNGLGPKEVVEHIFKRPFFPVDSKRIMHKMKFKALEDFDVHVIICHPKGGFTTTRLDKYKSILTDSKQVTINSRKYPVEECMVIKMAKANHGNSTCISYRFEENPTGKAFVFCTDHEDSVSIPMDIQNHLRDADLAIMDSQYDQARYLTKTGGFGHGTPLGCVKQALICGIRKLGFTHHDPGSIDDFIQSTIHSEAINALGEIKASGLLEIYNVGETALNKESIFICYDYGEYEV